MICRPLSIIRKSSALGGFFPKIAKEYYFGGALFQKSLRNCVVVK